MERLQQDLAASAGRTDAAKQETATVATQLAEARRQLGDTTARLADARAQLAEMQRQIAELDKTVQANKDTIAAKLSDLAKLAQQNRALAALRDTLEKQAQDAAARAMTDQQRRAAVETQLAEEKRLGDSARAQIALLNQQVDELKAQLASVAMALALTQMQGQEKDTQIANLGQKLNIALATKVEELQRYRSEFFGKLREVLANRPGIQIVGDRFVFQSEVLFPLGSAELTQAGQNGITALAITIKDIAKRDTARHQMDPARRWPHRPAADQGVSRVRIQLGAVGGARHHRGETADRRWRAGRSISPRRDSPTTSRSIPKIHRTPTRRTGASSCG